MSKCDAASAGGGFIFKCVLDADHDYSHQPEVFSINNEKVED